MNDAEKPTAYFDKSDIDEMLYNARGRTIMVSIDGKTAHRIKGITLMSIFSKASVNELDESSAVKSGRFKEEAVFVFIGDPETKESMECLGMSGLTA